MPRIELRQEIFDLVHLELRIASHFANEFKTLTPVEEELCARNANYVVDRIMKIIDKYVPDAFQTGRTMTWHHDRKGRIEGKVVKDLGALVQIKLSASICTPSFTKAKGTVINLRKSLLKLVCN